MFCLSLVCVGGGNQDFRIFRRISGFFAAFYKVWGGPPPGGGRENFHGRGPGFLTEGRQFVDAAGATRSYHVLRKNNNAFVLSRHIGRFSTTNEPRRRPQPSAGPGQPPARPPRKFVENPCTDGPPHLFGLASKPVFLKFYQCFASVSREICAFPAHRQICDD